MSDKRREIKEWAHLDSNQEPKRYERRALPLSYGPADTQNYIRKHRPRGLGVTSMGYVLAKRFWMGSTHYQRYFHGRIGLL